VREKGWGVGGVEEEMQGVGGNSEGDEIEGLVEMDCEYGGKNRRRWMVGMRKLKRKKGDRGGDRIKEGGAARERGGEASEIRGREGGRWR